MNYEEKVNEAVAFLQGAGMQLPRVGLVLGTGLGKLVRHINMEVEIAYSDIPHFPVATAESHHGRLIYGRLAEKQVLVMSGRFHYYEGYSAREITLPVRVMKLLGIDHLFLSNAAGAINRDFKKGGLMLIEDHIDLLPDNPLFGRNVDTWGERFPDMSAPYNGRMNQLLHQAAGATGTELYEGVYAAVAGPNLETRAEYRFLDRIGADAVGMSTVPEVIVCAHMGLPCAAISVLTDECDPDNLKPIDIQKIMEVAAKAEDKLIRVLLYAIERV